MNVCVTLMHRFERTPDGAIWTRSNHQYAQLRRYLGVFETARMLARVRDVAVPPVNGQRADGEGISFCALPCYVGFAQFLRRWRAVRRAALKGIGERDAVILNLPSPISALIEPWLRRSGHPYAVQLLGDPWDLYAKGALRHPLRPLIRWWFTRSTTAICARGCAVRYVTEHALQRRYPAAPGASTWGVSDASLEPAAFVSSSRVVTVSKPLRLVFVGSLEFPYKGADVLIQALRLCRQTLPDIRLTIVGDGKERENLALLARHLGVGSNVHFEGMVSAGPDVIARLDNADLFVLPSLVEGLPRAMVEAMARALPCIGSDIGGIPELLDCEDIFPPGDAGRLAEKIIEVASSPPRMTAMSARGLLRAQDFRQERLAKKQEQFHAFLGHATEMASRPRVLQILTRLGAGGAPIIVVLLTRILNRLGYSTQIVTGACEDSELDMAYLLNPEDSVIWVPEMSRSIILFHDLIALWRLFRLMKKTSPVIVQTHTAKAGVLGRIAARLAGVPIVIHTFHGHVMSECFSPMVSRGIRFVERLLAKFTDVICVLAPQQAHELESFGVARPEHLRVVPLGLDLEPFERIGTPSRKDGWLTVGWLGRLVEVKNIPLLIQTVEETLARNDRIRFIVAGDGPQRFLLEAAAERWGSSRFQWLGWVHDVTAVISQCDVLLQTSRNEGTPIALIQGMAAGRPFLSTPAGGVVDMVWGDCVRETGGARWFSNAILAPPDPKVFASVLCELQSHPHVLSGMDRDAATLAANRYSLESLARNYECLYSELLGHRDLRVSDCRSLTARWVERTSKALRRWFDVSERDIGRIRKVSEEGQFRPNRGRHD